MILRFLFFYGPLIVHFPVIVREVVVEVRQKKSKIVALVLLQGLGIVLNVGEPSDLMVWGLIGIG